MSFVVSGMTDYVKQEGFPLIVKAVVEGQTASMVNIISGLKGAAKVPFLTSAVTLKAGGSCGAFNGAGSSSTFTEVDVAVKPVLFEEALCVPALENKVLLYETSGTDEAPYAQILLNDKVKHISKALDELVWLGDTGSSDPFDGFVEAATNASLLQVVTGCTGTTVYEKIDCLIDAAVTADSTFQTSETVKIFLNFGLFRQLQKELVLANYFSYTPESQGGFLSLTFPGTRIEIVATEGLASSNNIYLADTQHLHIGTNLMSEAEGLTVYYNMPTNEIYLRSQFYMGVGVSKEIFEIAA